MNSARPKSIELVQFQEDLIPSGRKILSCVFKQKFGGDWYYKWTPAWAGDYGVERLFFKALEVEEYNDPKGIWTRELIQASGKVPPLADLKLPLTIVLGTMKEDTDSYEIVVLILSHEDPEFAESVEASRRGKAFSIGNCEVDYELLASLLSMRCDIRAISELCETEWEPLDGSEAEPLGVSFSIWLDKGKDKILYEAIGREIAWNIRCFLRDTLSVYKALKKGIEEA